MSEINNSSSDDLLSLRESILSVAIESATQEEKRAEILLKKSDFLMKYISATFVIINALCILYVSNTSIELGFICLYYFATGFSLLISMFFTIRAQILAQAKFFPTGQDIFLSIQHNYNDSNKPYTYTKSKTDAIKYYSKYTNSLNEVNNKRAKHLKNAYSFFIVSVFCIIIGSFVMIVLIA